MDVAKTIARFTKGITSGVTHDDVIWAYRLFLGREPESKDAITEKMDYKSKLDLACAFLSSSEFISGAINRQIGIYRYFDRQSPQQYVEHRAPPHQLLQLLERIAVTWRALGEERPHWSVLTSDQFLPTNIAQEEENFFASGEADVKQVLATIRRVGRNPSEFAGVLEYGCGLGRVTNHLARAFNSVIGCDVSASHLALARARTNKIGGLRITYREIAAPDFGMMEPIDLWYSIIVLQHNPPPLIAVILRKMMQMLRVGGLAIFQVPTYMHGYEFRLDKYLATEVRTESFEMHLLPQAVIFDIARESGCHILEVIEDGCTGDPTGISNSFVIGK